MKRYVTSLVIREMKVKLNEITFQFTGTLKINIIDNSTCYQECEATGTHKILGAMLVGVQIMQIFWRAARYILISLNVP